MKFEPSSLKYNRYSNELVIGTSTGQVVFWNLAHNEPIIVINGHSGRVQALAILQPASALASSTLVSAGRDKTVRLWDVSSRVFITALDGHFRQVFTLSVSADSNTIASGSLEGIFGFNAASSCEHMRMEVASENFLICLFISF